MTKVTLIKRSEPACPACNVLKTMLDGEGIEHEVIDITTDPDAVEKYDLTGVPVLLVGDQRFNGVVPMDKVMEAMK